VEVKFGKVEMGNLVQRGKKGYVIPPRLRRGIKKVDTPIVPPAFRFLLHPTGTSGRPSVRVHT